MSPLKGRTEQPTENQYALLPDACCKDIYKLAVGNEQSSDINEQLEVGEGWGLRVEG
jgi:hypothetical protein